MSAITPNPNVDPIVFLSVLDDRMARIAEDILGVLVAKGLLAVADLPPFVQQLIAQRQSLRAQIGTQTP